MDSHDVFELDWYGPVYFERYTHRSGKIIVGTTLETIISIGVLC